MYHEACGAVMGSRAGSVLSDCDDFPVAYKEVMVMLVGQELYEHRPINRSVGPQARSKSLLSCISSHSMIHPDCGPCFLFRKDSP